MNKQGLMFIVCCLLLGCLSCRQPGSAGAGSGAGVGSGIDLGSGWQQQLDKELPLLGHRNWILVVDKAFPMQTSPGMEVINTDEKLLPVLRYALQRIHESTHVKPIIYTDKEIGYITETQSPGVGAYKSQLKDVLGSMGVQSLLHDSVFVRMDASSKLFKILVLKTNETLAYSSVFLQLDCAYWNAEKEGQLREAMKSAAR
jgi:hypothetical protein